ncbi:hypothetical protein M3650_24055 [Paenibacillus sp. MER TA 81-3]|uniref:nSTAND3 domain-containing NTPase n=1 Tax=Paenibacillus sp. MER TA 81-3 TaxID=2939573 RepID=UPI0020421E2A|nr:hypothetical protein [Paenibacillus sp. MER TA 81-3]MCM3341613.1 hypothetical protein [Paenibacillus sp. MER TA 81-3]
MSIELIGPQGYEYQYLATLFIALTHLRERQDVQLIVEKAGGEDAELKIINGIKEVTVEIQVKSTREDLTVREFAQWLSHFPDRESNNNLLDRLKSDDDRFVLFITRARAMDLVRPFLTDTIAINTNAFNNELLSSAIDHIRTTYGEGSTLEQERANFCVGQASYFNSNRPKLRSVFKRTLVWEQREEEALKNNCREILHNSFIVPLSMTDKVLLQLLDLIKQARDQRKNVIPSIIQLLDTFSGERIPLNHVSVKRETDVELISTLETTNVLLLTGISFCGKTHIAREIASSYQEKGYRCIIESDIKEASRFLNQISIEDKLCLIEDPFGQVELEERYYEVWAELSDLVTRLTPNKKIIVTSKIELLRSISKGDNPDQWMIHDQRWKDLTVRNHEFVMNIWEAYCTEKQIPDEVYQLVKYNLTNTPEENLLQPGQLRYLAYTDKSNLQDKDFSQLVELATFDAQKLGMYFGNKSDNFRKTLIALGLGASPRHAINTEDLTFILSNSDTRPSVIILEDTYKSITFPGKETPPPSFPVYDIDTTLQDWVLEQLDELESHGYISIINNKIRFTHPTYHEAAKYVILHQSRLRLRAVEGILWRGVSCLETDTALSYTKFLNKLHQSYFSNMEFQKTIVSIAINGLNSIFPAVRDASLGLLVSHIDHLEDELQLKVFNYVKHDDIDNERLLWHNGEPWIEITDNYNFLDSISDMLSKHKQEGIDVVANRLINPEEAHTVTSEEAWNIVSNGYLFEEFDKNIILIKQLLSYKESFIREKITFTFIDQFCEGQDELITTVFSDEHPNVVFQAIRGALNGWHGRSADSKKYLLSHMKMAMLDKIIASKANRFMIDFGDEYGAENIDRSNFDVSQKRDLWEVWSELFTLFLRSIPDKFVSVNEYHLFNTVTNSINNIPSEKVINVCESWLEWIERNIQFRMLHEVGYAISDYLLAGTQPEERVHLTDRILDQQDTNFLTVALAEYINNWEHLSEREQGKIFSLLQSQRIDLQWLKAVSLTRSIVPTEILTIILGEENKSVLVEDVDSIIEKFPPALLVDCIRVYAGHPQPLWWLGYHHARLTRWPEILLKLIELPEHPAFTVAIKNFVDKFIMGDFKDEIRSKVVDIWSELVKSNDDDVINLLFNTLRMECITYNGPDSQDLWIVFFRNIDQGKKGHFLSNIVEEIEAYSYFNDLDEIFGKEIFFEQILPRVQVDYTIVNLVIYARKMIQGVENSELVQATYDCLLNFYIEDKPRLKLTNRIVKNFLRKFFNDIGSENELLTLIEQAEKQRSNKGREVKENLYDHYDLDNWVSVNTQV